MKIIIIEKDANIKNLTEKIEKHEEMNEMFKKQTSEFESQKKILEEFLNTGCANCKEKMKKIEAHKEVIQNLQVNITKKQETEAELEKTKTKLKESVKIITKKNSKIQELNDNLEDIMKQIEEVRYQRENLEKRLQHEESLRAYAETKLVQEIMNNNSLKNSLFSEQKTEKSYNLPNFSEIVSGSATPSSKISSIQLQNTNSSIKNNPDKHKRESPELRYENDSNFKNFSILDFPSMNNSTTSRKFNLRNVSSASSSPKKTKVEVKLRKTEKKKETIMKILKLTKEEYQSLSKNTRIELFECLFAHKDKCGSDCEHLKRAMMIRARNKAPVYPTKKYNIVKY